MGASLTMIDRHYGHLARDGREHAIRLLDELSAAQRPRWTLVDATWTPERTANRRPPPYHRAVIRDTVSPANRTCCGPPKGVARRRACRF
jgi:hypothetical protein